jgi:hypothetical protein
MQNEANVMSKDTETRARELRAAAIYKIVNNSSDNSEVVDYYAGEGFDAGYNAAMQQVAALTAERDKLKQQLAGTSGKEIE